jgi:redox-sensitive bicupin YhaK (pirin superfamily)
MADPIELLIQGRAHELGPGFAVRRVLPSVKRRMVGPFIFFDHFGPMVVAPGGDGMEVRPHPHIGLATVTYLFDGGIFHRDSLGYAQAIRPGDVNWMTAGAGIAHSERTEPEMRRAGFRMHGIQTWVALPRSHEETAPSFEHVEAAKLPAWQESGENSQGLLCPALGAEGLALPSAGIVKAAFAVPISPVALSRTPNLRR